MYLYRPELYLQYTFVDGLFCTSYLYLHPTVFWAMNWNYELWIASSERTAAATSEDTKNIYLKTSVQMYLMRIFQRLCSFDQYAIESTNTSSHHDSSGSGQPQRTRARYSQHIECTSECILEDDLLTVESDLLFLLSSLHFQGLNTSLS